MMLDLQDRFINWLMSSFYEELQSDVERYSIKVTEALQNNKSNDVDLYLRMITETRGILNDLSDENMETKDFVHLILDKYRPGPEGPMNHNSEQKHRSVYTTKQKKEA